jgi:RNA recognition motif-containing protein
MSFTVFLGNLPAWVTKDDIKSWLNAENLVFDDIKVIRNPETQESKGFAFIDTPNSEEMNSIIRRFDRAPLEDRMLRANQAQPPKSKGQQSSPMSRPAPAVSAPAVTPAPAGAPPPAAATTATANDRPRRERGGKKHKRPNQGPQSAFAEELAKAL